MVIDTSVLIAILANEPEAELFEAAIGADPIRLISAASVLEAAIVAGARYGDIVENWTCCCTKQRFRLSR